MLRTLEPWLDAGSVSCAHRAESLQAAASRGFELVPVREFIALPTNRLALGTLCRDAYLASHAYNPPAQLTVDAWLGLALDDEVMPDASFVALRSGRLVGFAMLHRHDEAQSAMFGWCGLHHGLAAEEQRLIVLALTARQLQAAEQAGVRRVQGEFDSTDHVSMIRFRELPFADAPAWLTFRQVAVRTGATPPTPR